MAVPDTNLLVSKSDINLLLCKHQFSRISEIKHCIDIAGQVGKDFNGIIYNFYEKPEYYITSYYGNYAYKYYADKYLYNAYEYKDEDKSETYLALIGCFLIIFIQSCSIGPGMRMDTKNSWFDEKDFVTINSDINNKIYIEELTIDLLKNEDLASDYIYKIGPGDKINITIWGLPEVFPIQGTFQNQNYRTVDSKGYLYFPYVGNVLVAGKDTNTVRDIITNKLEENFNNPQLDVAVTGFESQKYTFWRGYKTSDFGTK